MQRAMADRAVNKLAERAETLRVQLADALAVADQRLHEVQQLTLLLEKRRAEDEQSGKHLRLVAGRDVGEPGDLKNKLRKRVQATEQAEARIASLKRELDRAIELLLEKERDFHKARSAIRDKDKVLLKRKERLHEQEQTIARYAQLLHERDTALLSVRQERDAALHEVARVLGTRSWKFTKPLRYLFTMLNFARQ